MIATRYEVRCNECGGDSAPIVNSKHLGDYCDQWRKACLNTLESIEKALTHKINAQMPPDSTPDRIALPKLQRLEEKQARIEQAIQFLRCEVSK